MTNDPSKKPARPGRGHGKERGRLFYLLWGFGFIGFIGFPIWLEQLGIWVDRIPLYPSAIFGESQAQYELAYTYRSPRYKFGGTNYKTALHWDLEAAEQGHIGAMYSVAHAYYSGRGTEVSLNNAAIWYQKLADLGEKSARDMLTKINDKLAEKYR